MVKDDEELGIQLFLPFFTWVCVWTGLLCIILATVGATQLICYFTLFAGELFGGLIAILFMQQAIHGTVEEFHATSNHSVNGLWAVLTMLGLPVSVFYFLRLKHSNLLNSTWRALADYAPVLMVIVWTALSALLPANGLEGLPQRVDPISPTEVNTWSAAEAMGDVPAKGVLLALGPALAISVLFFFDHTVSSQLAQTGDDIRVARSDAYAWDLLILGGLTVMCGLLGLPPVNGVIPQAPMHARALKGIKYRQLKAANLDSAGVGAATGNAAAKKFASADTDGDGALTREEWVLKFGNADSFDAHDLDGDGAVSVLEYQMGELDVMEQRGSNLVQALLCGACAMCTPMIKQLPTSVLWGYFAFMALESVPDMQLSNRIMLLFVETSAREAHLEGKPYATVQFSTIACFTLLQLSLLIGIWALIVFGGIAGIAFPIPILLLLPLRSYLLPRWFGTDNMRMLDEAVYETDQNSATVTPAAPVDVPLSDDANPNGTPAQPLETAAEEPSVGLASEVTPVQLIAP